MQEQENTTFTDDKKERDFEKEYQDFAKEQESIKKDFKPHSANHQESIEKECISDIENSDFYKSDAYDKLEQFSAYEENINKELGENLKRQKEIEEQLKQNTQENNKENNENFNKEKVNPKDKEDLEKELKELRIKERELKNDLDEKRRQSQDDFIKCLNAKDMNELISLLSKIYYRRKERKAIKERLKDNKENQKLSKEELKILLKLESIAKDLSQLAKNEENKEFLFDISKGFVDERKEARENLKEISKSKDISKSFTRIMEDFEKASKKADIKKQNELINEFGKLYEKTLMENSEFKNTHQEQFKKVKDFYEKTVLKRESVNANKKDNIFKKAYQGFTRAI